MKPGVEVGLLLHQLRQALKVLLVIQKVVGKEVLILLGHARVASLSVGPLERQVEGETVGFAEDVLLEIHRCRTLVLN